MVEVKKLELFAISDLPARPSAGMGVVEVGFFCDFALWCVGAAWSAKSWCFAISDLPTQPSAGIGAVEVQETVVFCDSKISDRARMNALQGSCVSKRSRCGAGRIRLSRALAVAPCVFITREVAFLKLSRGRGFDSPLVRGSSSWKIATFKYESSTTPAGKS